VAAVAENLEIRLVVAAADAPVGAPERLDVIDLQAQLVARVGPPGLSIPPDLGRLEATPLAGVPRPAPRGPTGMEPDMVALELASVAVAAERGPARREGGAAMGHAAERFGQVDAGDVRLPGGTRRRRRGR
jgi:hypothetical protein